MFKILNEVVRVSIRLEHSNFEFDICFVFRASNFHGRKFLGHEKTQKRRYWIDVSFLRLYVANLFR